MVTAAEPGRVVPNSLLPTGKLIHGGFPILVAALPKPATISIPLHRFPLESSTRWDLDIATGPDPVARLVGVLICIERHRAGEVPVAELGNRADDEDVVAPIGRHLDGEGEGDGFGVRAGG